MKFDTIGLTTGDYRERCRPMRTLCSLIEPLLLDRLRDVALLLQKHDKLL